MFFFLRLAVTCLDLSTFSYRALVLCIWTSEANHIHIYLRFLSHTSLILYRSRINFNIIFVFFCIIWLKSLLSGDLRFFFARIWAMGMAKRKDVSYCEDYLIQRPTKKNPRRRIKPRLQRTNTFRFALHPRVLPLVGRTSGCATRTRYSHVTFS